MNLTIFRIALFKILLDRLIESRIFIKREPPEGKWVHPQVIKLLKQGYYNQRTREWHLQRVQRLTASDVDAVLMNNPYKRPNAVLKGKTSPLSDNMFSNYHTRHGNFYEDEAIQRFEQRYDKEVYEFGLIPHAELNWLGASPDGICLTGEMVEVKCPTRRKILTPEEYEPYGCPQHYYGQVQTQLWCAGLTKCYFVQYKPKQNFWDSEEQLVVTIVNRSNEWWENSYPIMKEFWESVLKFREEHPNWSEFNHYKKEKPEPQEMEIIKDDESHKKTFHLLIRQYQ